MKLIRREMAPFLKKAAALYPVVTVTGPRQSGKTTLVRQVFPRRPYVSMEDPAVREMATLDPYGFFSRYPEGAIIDEVQRVPHLLSYIQTVVDEKKTKGRFILTGSQQFNLLAGITQSLAGRTIILKLLPFSCHEISMYRRFSTDELLLNGGYPAIYSDGLPALLFYQNYVETYIERDLRQLINIKDLNRFKRFLKLAAGRIGQLLNHNALAGEVGVTAKTVHAWISILEASFIAFLLPPYHENRGKRIIKSPKLYFYDPGLAAHLLGIESASQMGRDPLRGALFENLALCEMTKGDYNSGRNPDFYFYRDSNGVEVDIVRQDGHDLIPNEVKSSATFNRDFFKGLFAFRKLYDDRVTRQNLIYDGRTEKIGAIDLLNVREAAAKMK
jgi:uncharacterized protein